MTRINGWRRAWVLTSALWAVVVLAFAGRFQSNVDQVNLTLFALRVWIMPVAAIYGLGVGLAWVRRGFQVEAE